MQDISNTMSNNSNNSTEESTEQLFYIEDFTDDLIRKFNTSVIQPYFRNVYQDLLLRSAPSKDSKVNNTIDRVTLVEFINLPGILSDRFYALVGNGSKTDARVV